MRPEKQLLLDEIKEQIDTSKALFFTRYGRLTPNKAHELRETIIKSGGNFEVVRKRILIKAASDANVSLDKDMLEGHVAVVFVEGDPIAMAKTIFGFTKDNEDLLTILGGQFEGKPCSAQEVEQLSKLPGKDEMRAQLLSVFEAPMSQTLAVMEALLTSVMHCLENKANAENKEIKEN